ncbi:MAG: ATP-grasp domain-containing protein, partial [Lachnospiraceae bacterium]|nr:ATP-grasp domain-containing protein [Lachnospiraceae bacterium]
MKKLAVIGASYLQEPLIEKAKDMGIETHVFAWAADDVGEKSADYFYPISIVDKEDILHRCQEIGIDGICSIASDLAAITVNYVAYNLGLIGNSPACTEKSTNKHKMRECFKENGDPSPLSICVESVTDLEDVKLKYPVIVKPLDRSGSRGITKVMREEDLETAIEYAKSQGFDKRALVEEFVCGEEYSVECISWQGKHKLLNVTKKYTTGAPGFIETGHMEPALLSDEIKLKIKDIIFHALDSLGIEYGASHSEIKIDGDVIQIIEIGGRMGGDYIGSHLVELSTGIDFVKAVIQIAMGEEPELVSNGEKHTAGVRFVFTDKDTEVLKKLKDEKPDILVLEDVHQEFNEAVNDSS